MVHRTQKISLEKIAKEKLAKRTIRDIDVIKLEVWEDIEPELLLNINKRNIRFRLNYLISTKKFLTWFGGITATIGGLATILKWIVPIFIRYLTNQPP